MKRVRWCAGTQADIAEIWHYISRDDEAAADAMIERIFDLTALLQIHPEAGSPVARLPGVRSRRVGRYRLFYRFKDDAVQVLAVRHTSRCFMKVVAERVDD